MLVFFLLKFVLLKSLFCFYLGGYSSRVLFDILNVCGS